MPACPPIQSLSMNARMTVQMRSDLPCVSGTGEQKTGRCVVSCRLASCEEPADQPSLHLFRGCASFG